MHILFVSDVGVDKVIGGAERALNAYVEGFRKNGHRVELLGPRILSPAKDDSGWKKYIRLFRGIFLTWWIFLRMARKNPPDIINFHQPLSALLVLLCQKSRSIPKIYTFHSSAAQEYATRLIRSGTSAAEFSRWHKLNIRLRKWMERYVLERSQRIMVLSAFSSKIVTDFHGIPLSRLVLIPGGADLERFSPEGDRAALGRELLPERSHVLFTVRNLVPRMGLENLIEAMSLLIENHPDLLLIIGGEGPLKTSLAALIERCRLEQNVRFEGFIPEEKLSAYYRAADIFVLPTRMLEGFGLVTVEALACGTPVVGTPVGGTVEILEGLDRRLICKGTTPRDIASGLDFFLKNPAELKEIAKMCRTYVEARYDWEKVINRAEELFESYIA